MQNFGKISLALAMLSGVLMPSVLAMPTPGFLSASTIGKLEKVNVETSVLPRQCVSASVDGSHQDIRRNEDCPRGFLLEPADGGMGESGVDSRQIINEAEGTAGSGVHSRHEAQIIEEMDEAPDN